MLFAQQAGVKLQYIPYKGSQPLITDLIGGFVKVGFNPIPVSRAAIEGKLIRALAATSLKRSAAFPDLPTVAESGLPGYDAVLTYGIVAPAGTPRPIVDKLNAVLRAALATDEVKRRLAQEGAEPLSDHAGGIRRRSSTAKTTKWSALIKSAGIQANEEHAVMPYSVARWRCSARRSSPRAPRRRRTIRPGRSRWSCRMRPAAATTSWRASPPRR